MKVGQFTLQLHHPECRSPTGLCPEAPCYTLYTLTTACPHTAPPLLSNLRMILWFWASSTTMTRPHTWMRWRDLHHGARTTVSLWTWAKTKELIVDFRKRQQQPYTPLMISGTPVERVSSFKYPRCKTSPRTWLGYTHSKPRWRKPGQRLYHLRTAEEIQGLTSYPENVLFRGHRKCSDSVHLSVV